MPYLLHVYFTEGCGMEHLRAFMLVNTLHEMDMKPFFYPSDIETNPETANDIIENGFISGFPTEKIWSLPPKRSIRHRTFLPTK